ncbi:MAG: hypothetical protein KBD76_16390 [Bacteriovorax sp.]|nr:hypothetical protein [Bacteriovorax sp.]
MLDQLAVLLFTTTKGHFGFKNSYEFVVKDLDQRIFPKLKLAHIKYQKDELRYLGLIEDSLQKRGFKTLTTEGKWGHNSTSHASEYFKDQLKLFSSHALPYSFICEDDFLCKIESSEYPTSLKKILEIGMDFLEQNPKALCVRINSEPDRHKNGATKINDLIYRQDEDRTPWGSTFTFQPTIVRTRDYLATLRIINNNLHLLDSVHCEILSGQVFKQFSDDKSPFYFFDPELVWCEHIGEKEKLEKLNGITNQ